MLAWIDRRNEKSGLVVKGLVLLAMVQAGAIVVSATRPKHPSTVPTPDLVIGEAIPAIQGRDSLSVITSVPFRRKDTTWTVLLAFSPTCAWCDSVAPRWKSWTRGTGSRAHVVAIASGDPSAAIRYTHVHDWKIAELIVVDSALTGVLGRRLTRKTPWLFLIDASGILRFSGHGNEVGAVDSLVGISR